MENLRYQKVILKLTDLYDLTGFFFVRFLLFCLIYKSSAYLARSIAPLLASAEFTIPSNLERGLYIDTVGLLGGTGGPAPFLGGPTPLTWKLLVMRVIVELILVSDTIDAPTFVRLGTTL